MGKRRALVMSVAVVLWAASAWAGDYLFVNPVYLSQTRVVINDARAAASALLANDAEALTTFTTFSQTLDTLVVDRQRKQALKKIKADDLESTADTTFAKALNDFKDGLSAMADIANSPIEKIIPSYDRWNRLETAVVKRGLEERLAAYETRFGAESEPINILEYVVSQKFFSGDEGGPAAWEPIFRVTPVQLTSRGNGLTSTAQVGMNFYFVDRSAPTVLKWLGVTNHVGVAAAVQYLDEPGIFNAKGKPSYGVIVHLDRKEVGLSWDDDEDKIRFNLGYAFQFVPMAL